MPRLIAWEETVYQAQLSSHALSLGTRLRELSPLYDPPTSPGPRDATEGTLLQRAALSCGGCVADSPLRARPVGLAAFREEVSSV